MSHPGVSHGLPAPARWCAWIAGTPAARSRRGSRNRQILALQIAVTSTVNGNLSCYIRVNGQKMDRLARAKPSVNNFLVDGLRHMEYHLHRKSIQEVRFDSKTGKSMVLPDRAPGSCGVHAAIGAFAVLRLRLGAEHQCRRNPRHRHGSSGAVVPGTNVVILNTQTGVKTELTQMRMASTMLYR